MARPTKYNEKKVNRICSLIEKDTYTVSEICSLSGISEDTYYTWQKEKPEFSERIKEARDKYDEIIVKEAKKSLIKLIQGYDVEEKKTVFENDKNGKPRIKEQTTTKKHYQPNVAATIFLLTNKASDEYKNRQNTELTGKDGKDLITRQTDDELDARIKELEKKIAK